MSDELQRDGMPPEGETPLADEPQEILPAPPENPASVAFYSAAVPRIKRFIAGCGGLAALICLVPWRWAGALGVLLGAALAWYSFASLTRAVEGIGDRIVNASSSERGGRLVFRFLSRIFLIALAGYATFNLSARGFYGLMVGLSVPVPAMLCEAACECYAAFRRGL